MNMKVIIFNVLGISSEITSRRAKDCHCLGRQWRRIPDRDHFGCKYLLFVDLLYAATRHSHSSQHETSIYQLWFSCRLLIKELSQSSLRPTVPPHHSHLSPKSKIARRNQIVG